MNQRATDLKSHGKTKKIESLHGSDPFDPVQEIYFSLIRIKMDDLYAKLERLKVMQTVSKAVMHFGCVLPAYRDDVFFCAMDEALFNALTSSDIYAERGPVIVRGVFLYEFFSSLARSVGCIRFGYEQDGSEVLHPGPDKPIRSWLEKHESKGIRIQELSTQQAELKTPLSYIALVGCCASLADLKDIHMVLACIHDA